MRTDEGLMHRRSQIIEGKYFKNNLQEDNQEPFGIIVNKTA